MVEGGRELVVVVVWVCVVVSGSGVVVGGVVIF